MSDLDEAALTEWLGSALPQYAGPIALTKFAGGQSNPTYQLSTPAGSCVLRRKPFGPLLPSAHAVEREFRLMRALHPTGYPVPEPLALCEDPAVIGASFYVMRLVEGRNFLDGTLPEIDPPARRPIYEAMIGALARLHNIDHVEIGLENFGKQGNYFARQVDIWTRQYRLAQTDDIAEVENLIEFLPRTLPEQDRTSIIHGDFRIDNLIFAARSATVSAVIDWELATLGDPLADFSYFAINWIMPADGRSSLQGVDLVGQGIPLLDEMGRLYCGLTGRDRLPDLAWYFAFNLFRLIAILQGIKKRVQQGNASSVLAEQQIARIGPLAHAAWEQAQAAKG